ncbi:CBO0543 family protein [Bacillus sp. B1-b2]|uniref:CBO0543 family protein n=1 Tax=Bacillus sp. B1-b2 TaxID=2653201 RepID=UPI0039B0806D
MFFKKANKTSFTFEYFVYPALCSLFNVNFPEKRNYISNFLYYTFFCSFITLFELYAIKYTNLITYKKWTWYFTFSTYFMDYIFLFSRVSYVVF